MINSLGFIGHPIDVEHLYKTLGIWGIPARKISKFTLTELLKKLPPYRLNTIKNIRSLKDVFIDCHTIICPMLPEDMVGMDQGFVLGRITQAVRKAEKLGAKIVTLGGFTSIIGNEGEDVSKLVNIAVTSGNTYTAGLAIEGIVKAAYLMDMKLSDSTLSIIGATGDIGSICAKILSKKVKRVNLVARNEPRLTKFAEHITEETDAVVNIIKYTKDAVKDADIILTVTSAITAIIDPLDLKPGSIVCDVAIPANVAKQIVNVRNDVFVFEGGLAKLPYQGEVSNRVFNELMPTGSIYGCLAEGIALSFEGRFENYSIGRGNISEEKINEILKIAKKHGMRLSDFFCGYRFYSDEDIEVIKLNAKRNTLYMKNRSKISK